MPENETDPGVPTNPSPESVVENRGGCAWWALVGAVAVLALAALWWVLATKWGRGNPVPAPATPTVMAGDEALRIRLV